ncbi:MAG: hypothetical protein IPK85_01975 [Gemmatimonadetes bacterium]|nr:hypothetical protein [Gemmatimonadota bacterium]
MSKRSARASAMTGQWTVGMLRSAIERARGAHVMSVVNPTIPHGKALDIYMAALADLDDAERPVPMVPDVYTGRNRPSGMALTMINILQDCDNPPIPTPTQEG